MKQIFSIYWDTDVKDCTFCQMNCGIDNELASIDQLLEVPRDAGTVWEVLNPGETIELAEGYFQLDAELDLIEVQL